MSWNASIRIMSSSGSPKSGAKVTIFFSGIIGTHTTEYTDSDGWAHFDIPPIDDYRLSVDNIYVNGEEVDNDLGIDRGDTLSYTIS